MRSHEFSFSLRSLARALWPTMGASLVFVALLRVSHVFGWLPPPAISADPDRTVFIHQLRASRTHNPAEIVLTGDSTCLVGVDARKLSQMLPGNPPALNLSAIIGYGLNVYGSLVSDFTATNSGQVRAVVLLVCAPKLTSSDGPPDGAMSLWQKIDTWPDDFFGINLLRRCLLAYIVDTPLQRAGAEFFGFSSELDAYQTAHDGSLINFGNFTIHQPMDTSSAAPLALSQEIKAESRIFRGQVPVGTKLFIGLTPGPTSFVSAQEARERPELLREWNRFIRADVMLTNLPSTLPDWCFSESKHLNQIGQKRFTALLAKELAPLLSGTNAPASLSSP